MAEGKQTQGVRRVAAKTASPKQAQTGKPKIPRQAVVIVHGMGEQRPLETLRGFVEAVWGARPIPGAEPSDDDVWLVPDLRVGLKELARITTRKVNGVRTDFYELYWSDLLVGNTLAQIRSWVTGLLLRWPHQVPRESFLLWVGLWVIVGIIVGLGAFVGLSGSWGDLWKQLSGAKAEQTMGTAIASGLLAAALYYALWQRLTTNLRRRGKADQTFPGIWANMSPDAASVTVALSWFLFMTLPAIIGALAYWYFPWAMLLEPKTAALVAAVAIAAILAAWVVPVFGDVARYVRTSPDAVAARAAIRDRGLELMRALHGPIETDKTLRYDHGELSSYNRIAIVGHSLGSIVAYDVLRLFWEERGPTRLKPAEGDALEALRDVDAFCRQSLPDPTKFNIAAFREKQEKAGKLLAGVSDNWRITDFVTLGSPLTHAEFLISQDRAAFEERKAERLFPTCPPMLEPGEQPSFLYKAAKYAHHAAMFSTMRWTNIYAPSRLIFFGDFIGGPCQPNFGPGVIDLEVSIRRGGLFSRLVTHTDYWNLDAKAYATDQEGEKLGIPNLSKSNTAHLTLLKKSLALRPL